MLILARKVNEKIRIGDDITLVVVEIRGDKVRFGIEAPLNVDVHREEIYNVIHKITHKIPAPCLAPEYKEKKPQ